MAMLPVQAPPQREPVREIRPRLTGSSHRGLASRSDERLVAIARDGDERAFEVLYERHAPAILRYCRSLLRSTQEAEDVKQEVFVLAISALRRGAQPDMFRPWLYRVAHNACMSHLRMRRPVLVADNGVLVGPAAAAEPVQHHREELRQLLDDIGKLPDVQRGALLLREMDGFSYEQVGEVLGLPLSTVRASIFRARRTLQGLAAARDADCDVIQSELSDLADRRGRRGRHITSHLTVCSNCRDFRDGLRRRPTVLGGVAPVGPLGPGGLLLALKGKLLGGATAGGSAGTAVVTGAGGAKIAAVAASSIALLAGAGVEADHVIEHSRREAAITPRHVSVRAAASASAGADPARATVRRTAAGLTVTASDSLREGAAVPGANVHGSSPDASTRAPARVKAHHGAAPAAASVPAPAEPRTAAPATSDATGTTTDDTSGRDRTDEPEGAPEHGRHHGSDGDARDGDAKSGSSGSGSGSGSDDGATKQASPRTSSRNEGTGSVADKPAKADTPDAGDDTPRPPTPSRSESAGTPPGRLTDDDTGTPSESESTGSPTPGPAPAPAPDSAPEPPADDQEPPVEPAEVPATIAADAAGTAAATTADPAAVTSPPQP
jgi:RNA polymerase sigma factor (sigma-70 family)